MLEELPNRLIAAADAALSQAKSSGRDAIAVCAAMVASSSILY